MKPAFSVLKGGNQKQPAHSARKYRYLSGYATDTRLMGVVGIELTWKVFENPLKPDKTAELFKQIFYLDCEERYIDTYYECYGEDDYALRRERIRLVAALGGSLVPLKEKEARFLIQSYSGLTGGSTRLPEGAASYSFLLFPEQTLNQEEYDALSLRICGEVATPNYAVNYYLMRCASLDERGCAFMHGDVQFKDPEHIRPSDMPIIQRTRIIPENSTLYLNKISHSKQNPDLYQSESLTERSDQGYFITNCALMITDRPLRIREAEVISELHITDIEASMILKRPEFVSICQLTGEDNYFRTSFAAFTASFTETEYDTGRLFIKYKSNNAHAGNRLYRLNDDMEATYFLTDSNQILIMGYTSEEASLAEFNMYAALLNCDIYTEKRYEFPEPVLYEFINSGFEDFHEFLDYITDGSSE